MRRLFGAAVLVAFASAPLRAGATGPADEAEALLKSGVELRKSGRDAEALDAFRRALALAPTPRARAQTALAAQALNLWIEAEENLKLALAADDDPWIRQNRAALDRAARLIAGKLAWVRVRSNVPTATVLVNGRSVGRVAELGELRVVGGPTVIELRDDAYTPQTKSVTVVPETHVAIDVDLASAPPRASAPAAATAAPEDDDQGRGTLRLVGWSGVALGAIGTGMGAVFGVRAMDLKRQRDRECTAAGCTQAGVEHDRDGRDAALVSTISIAGGLAVATAGVVLVVLSPKSTHAMSASIGPRSIALEGRF